MICVSWYRCNFVVCDFLKFRQSVSELVMVECIFIGLQYNVWLRFDNYWQYKKNDVQIDGEN